MKLTRSFGNSISLGSGVDVLLKVAWLQHAAVSSPPLPEVAGMTLSIKQSLSRPTTHPMLDGMASSPAAWSPSPCAQHRVLVGVEARL